MVLSVSTLVLENQGWGITQSNKRVRINIKMKLQNHAVKLLFDLNSEALIKYWPTILSCYCISSSNFSHLVCWSCAYSSFICRWNVTNETHVSGQTIHYNLSKLIGRIFFCLTSVWREVLNTASFSAGDARHWWGTCPRTTCLRSLQSRSLTPWL